MSSSDAPDRLLTARVDDALKLCRRGPRFLGFLDPAEAAEIKAYTKYLAAESSIFYYGGYPEAERVMAGFFPDYLEIPEEDLPAEFPIAELTLTYREEFTLTHRDFLGALMAQGIQRSALGDILLEEGRAVIFVRNELQEYFLNGVEKIGRVGVKIAPGAQRPLPVAHRFLPGKDVVASERFDCMVSMLVGMSREKSAQAIRAGLVTLNYRECTDVSKKLSEGDILAVRSRGKFIIDTVGPLTKKGRLMIQYRKYQ